MAAWTATTDGLECAAGVGAEIRLGLELDDLRSQLAAERSRPHADELAVRRLENAIRTRAASARLLHGHRRLA